MSTTADSALAGTAAGGGTIVKTPDLPADGTCSDSTLPIEATDSGQS